ncbi:MAG TPA: tetratricopeptide repeat protein, partial [Candidatus Omnitrophota bacterium]|nr:tetratricopeptide repeat protein [Candidatus Omnitrophota bacterium]
YALMILSYGLALLSKEHSLVLPVLLLVYHYSFKKKIKAEAFFLIVGLATLYVVLRVAVLKELLPSGESYNTTFAQRLPGFFVALANYLRLLFLPFGLHMEYGRALFGWKDPRVFWGIVMLVGIVAYALRKKEKSPLIFFAIAWFLIALLPVSNLYGINAYMAEHWLYLPSVGFFLIMAKAIRVLFDNKDLKAFAVFLIAGLVFFYAYLTFRQNTYWREPLGFFERTLAYAPESPAVHYNLGNIYVEANRKEEAIRSYQKAIDLKPRYDEAYNNLGNVYSEIGRWEEGVLSYQKAIEITPDFADAHNNLGLAYFSLRQPEEAIRAYHKAIALKPDYAEAHNNLGVAYAAMNRREEAVASYKKAIALKPDHANAYFSLGNVYRAMDKKEEAAAAYKKATQINPMDAEAYYNLGGVYDLMNRQNEAAAAYGMAAKLDPAYGNPQGDAHK